MPIVRQLKIHRIPMLRRTCREVTRLVLQSQDRPLRLVDRIAIRIHMLICDACPRFLQQVGFMRQAIDRWRHYRDAE
jgi:hypothetical protein